MSLGSICSATIVPNISPCFALETLSPVMTTRTTMMSQRIFVLQKSHQWSVIFAKVYEPKQSKYNVSCLVGCILSVLSSYYDYLAPDQQWVESYQIVKTISTLLQWMKTTDMIWTQPMYLYFNTVSGCQLPPNKQTSRAMGNDVFLLRVISAPPNHPYPPLASLTTH